MAKVILNNVKKKYTNDLPPAVNNLSLHIEDKEFLVLVGPSGCGKSTALKMIAGLESVTDGEIYIGDEMVNDIQPKDRDISMVFQNYALYPTMNVYENIAFGLRLRKIPKYKIEEKVKGAARTLNIDHLLDRLPGQLSGGQKQRVALGRSIVRSPKVFLMDEPLSNLDAKMRVNMRYEIIKLHKSLNATTIYVTHDQTEAITMGDRIVIMDNGVLQQVGTPEEIYIKPENTFVAGFIGSPPMNFVQGRLINSSGVCEFFNGRQSLKIPTKTASYFEKLDYIGRDVIMGVRPENISLDRSMVEANRDSSFRARVQISEFFGSDRFIYIDIGNGDFVISRMNTNFRINDNSLVEACVFMDSAIFFDLNTKKRII